jgi:hypothetical protein
LRLFASVKESVTPAERSAAHGAVPRCCTWCMTCSLQLVVSSWRPPGPEEQVRVWTTKAPACPRLCFCFATRISAHCFSSKLALDEFEVNAADCQDELLWHSVLEIILNELVPLDVFAHSHPHILTRPVPSSRFHTAGKKLLNRCGINLPARSRAVESMPSAPTTTSVQPLSSEFPHGAEAREREKED